jgi:hypothetical protein
LLEDPHADRPLADAPFLAAGIPNPFDFVGGSEHSYSACARSILYLGEASTRGVSAVTSGRRGSGRGIYPVDAAGHRRDDLRVLAHAEIVVGAPDDDLAGLVAGATDAIAETAGDPLEIGKDAVAPLGMERRNRLGEIDR